jgi:hypothetical protein
MSNAQLQFTLHDNTRPTHIVVWQDRVEPTTTQTTVLNALVARIENLERTILELRETVESREPRSADGLFFPQAVNPIPDGIQEIQKVWDEYRERGGKEDSEESEEEEDTRVIHIIKEDSEAPTGPVVCVSESSNDSKEKEPEVEEGEVVETEENQEKQEVVEEGEVVEETQEEEEEAEEEEEEGEALTEFEWNGVTYYRDSELQVYMLDEDGDLNDTPIGRWSEEKQKILKFRASAPS